MLQRRYTPNHNVEFFANSDRTTAISHTELINIIAEHQNAVIVSLKAINMINIILAECAKNPNIHTVKFRNLTSTVTLPPTIKNITITDATSSVILTLNFSHLTQLTLECDIEEADLICLSESLSRTQITKFYHYARCSIDAYVIAFTNLLSIPELYFEFTPTLPQTTTQLQTNTHQTTPLTFQLPPTVRTTSLKITFYKTPSALELAIAKNIISPLVLSHLTKLYIGFHSQAANNFVATRIPYSTTLTSFTTYGIDPNVTLDLVAHSNLKEFNIIHLPSRHVPKPLLRKTMIVHNTQLIRSNFVPRSHLLRNINYLWTFLRQPFLELTLIFHPQLPPYIILEIANWVYCPQHPDIHLKKKADLIFSIINSIAKFREN